jgi:hypothetical protein
VKPKIKANVVTHIVVLSKQGDIFVLFHDGETHVVATPEQAAERLRAFEAKRAKRKVNDLTVAVVEWRGFGDNFQPPKVEP